MIHHTTRGRGFKGLMAYLTLGRKGQETPERVGWMEARNLPAADAELAAAVMRHTATQSTQVERPVYHVSLSWAPEDRPSRQEMAIAANKFIENLGLGEHQAMIVCHEDTEHAHVHVVVNRVHPVSGKAWKGSNDYQQSRKVLRALERERAWRDVPCPRDQGEGYQCQLTRGEMELAAREGRELMQRFGEEQQADIREKTLDAFRTANSWADLQGELGRHGLTLVAKGRGMVIIDPAERREMKLSELKEPGLRREALEDRFGQSWGAYQGQREIARTVEEVAGGVQGGSGGSSAGRGDTSKEPARDRVAEPAPEVRVESARQRMERALKRYHALHDALDAAMKARIAREDLGRQVAGVRERVGVVERQLLDSRRSVEHHRAEVERLMFQAFENPAQAIRTLEKFDRGRGGIEHGNQVLKDRPGLLGRRAGRSMLGLLDDGRRREAKDAMGQLPEQRQALRGAELREAADRWRLGESQDAQVDTERAALEMMEVLRDAPRVPEKVEELDADLGRRKAILDYARERIEKDPSLSARDMDRIVVEVTRAEDQRAREAAHEERLSAREQARAAELESHATAPRDRMREHEERLAQREELRRQGLDRPSEEGRDSVPNRDQGRNHDPGHER